MKTTIKNFKKIAKLVKSDERYDIYDYKLDHLIISITILKPKQETRGHEHKNIEEIYICLEGKGKIEIGKDKFDFKRNDLATIKPGKFHKVKNSSASKKIVFLSIFEKYKRK